MPVYTYRCNDCNYRFEQRQKMTDAPLSVCPACHGDVRRVVNSVGVLFKGSGFYVTDNRNGNGPATSKSPATTENTTTPDGKTEKSPASTEKPVSKETTAASTTAASAAA
jgi:putative FmdB family regulatory protein